MWFPLAIRLPPLLFLLSDVPDPATFDKFIFFPLSKWKRSWDNNRNSNLTNISEFVYLLVWHLLCCHSLNCRLLCDWQAKFFRGLTKVLLLIVIKAIELNLSAFFTWIDYIGSSAPNTSSTCCLTSHTFWTTFSLLLPIRAIWRASMFKNKVKKTRNCKYTTYVRLRFEFID